MLIHFSCHLSLVIYILRCEMMAISGLLNLPLEIRQQIYLLIHPSSSTLKTFTSCDLARPPASLAGLAFANRLLYDDIRHFNLKETMFVIPISSFHKEGDRFHSRTRSIMASPLLGRLRNITLNIDLFLTASNDSELREEMQVFISFLDSLRNAKESLHKAGDGKKWLRRLVIVNACGAHLGRPTFCQPEYHLWKKQQIRILASLLQPWQERCEVAKLKDYFSERS